VFYGSVIPFAVAVGILTVGLWIDRRTWTDVSPWRLVGWCGSGAVVTLLLVLLLIQYQFAEGATLVDLGFVSLMFVTYGAGLGLVVGGYDVRIQEARAKLAEKTRRLDEFASIVSHDLRNPLNVAQGYVELAQETGDLSDLGVVADAHDRMDAILADMLALAQNGDQAVSPTTVDLATAAEEAWAMVATGDATLTVTADVTIHADRGRLKTLFENLFRNSVEHGSTGHRSQAPEDSVEHGSTGSRSKTDDSVEHGSTSNQTGSDDAVEHGSTGNRTRSDDAVEHGSTGNQTGSGDAVERGSTGNRPETDDAKHASASSRSGSTAHPAPIDITIGLLDDDMGFYVADTGDGIPPEIRERVFEAAFTTAGGSGLGLAIVRAAADAHGWSHTLTESATGGARFEFRNVTFPDD
jgi:signal transduction histidine kinase